MNPLETLLSRPPLERRQAAISLIESLMSESDDAHDIYSAAFDALDDFATITVFQDEFGRPAKRIADEDPYKSFRGIAA